jgi:hypothetical protein
MSVDPNRKTAAEARRQKLLNRGGRRLAQITGIYADSGHKIPCNESEGDGCNKCETPTLMNRL